MTSAGAAGTLGSGAVGLKQLPLWGVRLDLEYTYAWDRLTPVTAKLSQGPSLGLDIDLADALQCRVTYRYAFAGDPEAETPNLAWLDDGGQDLTLGWDWDLAAAGMRGTTFSADFALHDDFTATDASPVGTGGINLAMVF